jgi:hypothetical protein
VVSDDANRVYLDAVDDAFGGEIDVARLLKQYRRART